MHTDTTRASRTTDHPTSRTRGPSARRFRATLAACAAAACLVTTIATTAHADTVVIPVLPNGVADTDLSVQPLWAPIDTETLLDLFAPEVATNLAMFDVERASELLDAHSTVRPEAVAIARVNVLMHSDDPAAAADLLLEHAPPQDTARWCSSASTVLASPLLDAEASAAESLSATAAFICDGELRPSSRHSDRILSAIVEQAYRTQHRDDVLDIAESALSRVDEYSVAHCEIAIPYARTLGRVGRATEGVTITDWVAANCDIAPDPHVRSLHGQLVRAVNAGETRVAREISTRIRTLYPNRSHADDALFWLAVDQSDEAAAIAADAMLTYPDGDMVGRIISIATDEFEGDARTEYLRSIANNPWRDPAYQTAGRVELELARIARDAAANAADAGPDNSASNDRSPEDRVQDAVASAGATSEACQWIGELIDRYPYAFTTAVALRDPVFAACPAAANVVVDHDRHASRSIEVTIRDEIAGPLQAYIELGAYRQATELLVGLDSLTDDEQWALAAVYALRGDAQHAHVIPRWTLFGWERHTPMDDARWRLAYPAAHSQFVNASSERFEVPTPQIWAIMREESAFDVDVASFAGARGLMQVMPATAGDHSHVVEGRWRTERLMDPQTNIEVGTHVLLTNRSHYGDDTARIASSYNAGRGRTRQWDARRGDWELIDWIEAIPFSETIHYVRRVMQSERVYTLLYGSNP